MSASAVTTAPHRPPGLVDPRAPRFAAALTALVLAVVTVTGSTWLLLAQTLVFALGVAGRSPYTRFYAAVIAPRLGPPAELEDTRPVRFAQGVGLVLAAVALVAVLLGWSTAFLVSVAAALAAAFLNAVFGICLGCEAYLLLQRARTSSTNSWKVSP